MNTVWAVVDTYLDEEQNDLFYVLKLQNIGHQIFLMFSPDAVYHLPENRVMVAVGRWDTDCVCDTYSHIANAQPIWESSKIKLSPQEYAQIVQYLESWWQDVSLEYDIYASLDKKISH